MPYHMDAYLIVALVFASVMLILDIVATNIGNDGEKSLALVKIVLVIVIVGLARGLAA